MFPVPPRIEGAARQQPSTTAQQKLQQLEQQLLQKQQQLQQQQLAAHLAAAEIEARAQAHSQAQLLRMRQLLELELGLQGANPAESVRPGSPARLPPPGLAFLMASAGIPVPPRGAPEPLAPQLAAPQQGADVALSFPPPRRKPGQRSSEKARRGEDRVTPEQHVYAAAVDSRQKKSQDTLRSYLHELRSQDPKCIFIARRINKIGFRSKPVLEKYFSQFGEITQVLVAHSKVKPFPNTGTAPRMRPGNFGLVVMKSPKIVEAILAQGPEHMISGACVQVHRFEQKELESGDKDDGDALVLDAVGCGPASGSWPSGSVGQLAASKGHGVADDGASSNSSYRSSLEHDGAPQTSSGSFSNGSNGSNISSASNCEGSPEPASSSAPAGLRGADLAAKLEQLGVLAGSSTTLSALSQDQRDEAVRLVKWTQAQLGSVEEECLRRIVERPMADGLSAERACDHAAQAAACASRAGNLPLAPPTAAAARPSRQPAPGGAKADAANQAASSQGKAALQKPVRGTMQEAEPPGSRWQPPSGGDMRDTLRFHLTQLSTEDPESIFIARRINKLGFRSREVLHQHFAQYGVVSRVLVAHSKVKPFRDSTGQLRTRPGGLGLIVMRDAATVRAILSLGEEQMVAGHQIRVQCFERPKVGDASCEGSGISNATTTAQDSKSQDSKTDHGSSHLSMRFSNGSNGSNISSASNCEGSPEPASSSAPAGLAGADLAAKLEQLGELAGSSTTLSGLSQDERDQAVRLVKWTQAQLGSLEEECLRRIVERPMAMAHPPCSVAQVDRLSAERACDHAAQAAACASQVGEASCEGSGISNATTTADLKSQDSKSQDSKSQDSKSQDSKSQDSKSDQGFSHVRSSDSDGSSEEARADGGLEDAIADNGPESRADNSEEGGPFEPFDKSEELEQ